MASSGNFATWNPLANTTAGLNYAGSVYSNGNTRFRGNTGGTATTQLTHGLSSGKWYIEIYIDGSPASGFPMIGIVASGVNSSTLQNTSNASALTITSDLQTVNGTKRVFGSTSSTSYGSGFSDGDICQMAIDIDNGKIWWGKNNTWFASGNPAGGSNAGDTFTGGTEMMVFVGSYSGSAYSICNAGQDSSFSGNKTSGSANAQDGMGFGNFFYAPPSSGDTKFLALCSANLPISDDIDPAQTDTDYPSKQFNTVLYTGTGSAQSIDAGLQADFVWAKNRGSQSHRLADSTRGSAVLFSDSDVAEDTTAGISFDSDGFNWTNTDGSNANDSSANYVAWCWKANGGTTANNTTGGTNSVTQANTKSGFSIITYTGFSGSSGSSTVGHSLTKAPEFIIHKSRTRSSGWWCQHTGLTNAGYFIDLSGTAGQNNLSGYGTMNAPTTSVFTINGVDGVGGESANYVSYAWHSVSGFSRFGSFEGNADNDGIFCYLGFKPSFIFIKNIDASQHWVSHDSARETFNPMDTPIDLDGSYAEYTSSARAIDITSNGFKCRTSDGEINANQTYIYGAWASTPYRYNNSF